MDSGRIALLEKAREYGSLAQNLTFQNFLDKSVTYRTLALYLGIQNEWWEEFWRSFSYASKKVANEKLRRFHFSCKAKYVPHIMNFLSSWFGKGTRISDIPKEEFCHAYHIIMRD